MDPTHSDNHTVQQQIQKLLRGKKTVRPSLRMTAMIDVIFLLLTFFVLTARFRSAEQFLPAGVAAAGSVQKMPFITEPLGIKIDQDGQNCITKLPGGVSVTLNRQTIENDLSDFAAELVKIMESQKRLPSDPVEIECSDGIKWDYLVKIYNVLYGIGINNITFAIAE